MSIEFGTVKWFASKNQPWGYINRDSGGEIFVHYKQILSDNQEDPKYRRLKAGQRVSFECGSGYFNPGTQALNVRIVEDKSGDSSVGDAGSVGASE